MTRNNRRFLYLSFILFFFVIAPILVLYSSGYRLDWAHRRLIKTSVINLNTRPKGAEIWLNGVNQEKKTPTILTGIFPGTYDIKLVKDGFLPWQNTITVRTSRASVLYSIILFRNTTSQLLVNENIIQLKNTSNNDQLLAITKQDTTTELKRLNLRDGSATTLVTRPGTITIEADPQYDQVVISQSEVDSSFELVKTNQADSSMPLTYLPEEITNLQWLNHDTLLGQNSGQLCQVQLTKNTVSCSQKNVSQFFVRGMDVYYLTNDGQTSYLYRSTSALETNQPLSRLPSSNNYTLLSTENKHLILADGDAHEFYLIEPQDSTFRQTKINNAAKDGFWLKNVEQFIYYNDNEIWRYDPKTAEHRLLQRVSDPIHYVTQLVDLPYLIFSRADRIEALELSEYAPTYTIIPLVTNARGWFTLTTDNLLLYQETNERARLWSRLLF
ncbi:MAG: PEGA domain-containing protein [Patescibacteria group bacterium]